MKLYNSIGPNPKMVRMFMKEKGIELPLVQVDLMGGENRKQPYLDRNPAGQCPALELDDGSYITEITAIRSTVIEVCGGGSLSGSIGPMRLLARTACCDPSKGHGRYTWSTTWPRSRSSCWSSTPMPARSMR